MAVGCSYRLTPAHAQAQSDQLRSQLADQATQAESQLAKLRVAADAAAQAETAARDEARSAAADLAAANSKVWPAVVVAAHLVRCVADS